VAERERQARCEIGPRSPARGLGDVIRARISGWAWERPKKLVKRGQREEGRRLRGAAAKLAVAPAAIAAGATGRRDDAGGVQPFTCAAAL